MQLTKSETLFETLCDEIGVTWERIPTDEGRTPDYDIWLGDVQVVVEVKQFDPNPEEKRTLRKSFEEFDESDLYDGMPGERVRSKVDSAMPQLKRRAQEVHPAVLVLYDNVQLWEEISDSYAVRAALYGIEVILITSNVAPGGGAEIVGRWFGPHRKASPNYNTTLSAVAMLVEREHGVGVDIYHNIFARHSLNPDLIRHPSITHYSMVKAQDNVAFQEWIEL